MFESIACQIADPKVTHKYLRTVTCDTLEANRDEYIEFTAYMGEQNYEDLTTDLRRDGSWATEMNDISIDLLSRELGLDILIITAKNLKPEIRRPLTEEAVTDNTIVLYRESNLSHYHATRLIPTKKVKPDAKPKTATKLTPAIRRKLSSRGPIPPPRSNSNSNEGELCDGNKPSTIAAGVGGTLADEDEAPPLPPRRLKENRESVKKHPLNKPAMELPTVEDYMQAKGALNIKLFAVQ